MWNEVFGERDTAWRRSAIAALWAEDGVFADPYGRYVGHTALNDAVSQLHARFAGFVFTPSGAPLASPVHGGSVPHPLPAANRRSARIHG